MLGFHIIRENDMHLNTLNVESKMRDSPSILTGHEKRRLPNKHGKLKTTKDLG